MARPGLLECVPGFARGRRGVKPGDVTVIRRALRKLADPAKAAILRRFFKTGPGEYGQGDRFLGITVPQLRILCRAYPDLPLSVVRTLLYSPFHEERLLALLALVAAFQRADRCGRRRICAFYLKHTRRVNNWDLVDLSAPYILGRQLREEMSRSRATACLQALARSQDLWQRRIAMVATLAFIRGGDCAPVFTLARMLREDREPLMHKAAGWMLREAGKRDRAALEGFLRRYCRSMPRTMLRYAIERFPPSVRRTYRAGRV